MAIAPAVVDSQCDGGSPRSGDSEQGQLVSDAGPFARTQGGTLRIPPGAMERSVRCEI